MSLLRRVFKLVPLDEAVLDSAIAAAREDLEDAIQAASAIRVKAEHIVTRNIRDFAQYGISAVSAEELLALLVT